MKAVSGETITVSSTAKSLTVPSGANCALMRVSDASIRFTVDASTPTASSGMLVLADEFINYTTAHGLSLFRAIRVTSTDATLDVLYYNTSK